MPRKKRGGGGGISRRAALAIVGGGGLLGVTGTGAFSQVDGERGFAVSTVPDTEASLGIDELKEDADCYPDGHTVTITNNLSETLDNNTVIIEGTEDLALEGNSIESVEQNDGATEYTMETLTGSNSYNFDVVLNKGDPGDAECPGYSERGGCGEGDPPGQEDGDPPGKGPPGKDPPGKGPPGKNPPGKGPPGKDPPGKGPPGEGPPGGEEITEASGTITIRYSGSKTTIETTRTITIKEGCENN